MAAKENANLPSASGLGVDEELTLADDRAPARDPRRGAPVAEDLPLSETPGWFYSVDGASQEGPVTRAALQAKISSGAVKPEHLAWRLGLAEWTEVKDLPELHPLPTAAAASARLKPLDTSKPPELPRKSREVSGDFLRVAVEWLATPLFFRLAAAFFAAQAVLTFLLSMAILLLGWSSWATWLLGAYGGLSLSVACLLAAALLESLHRLELRLAATRDTKSAGDA